MADLFPCLEKCLCSCRWPPVNQSEIWLICRWVVGMQIEGNGCEMARFKEQWAH